MESEWLEVGASGMMRDDGFSIGAERGGAVEKPYI